MGRRVVPCWLVTSVLFSSFLRHSLGASSTVSIESLDSTIRDRALDVLAQGRTGAAYQVPLPSDLSGVRAWVRRMSSGNLWMKGTRFGSSIRVPPMTTTVPVVTRLVVVYQDLGIWSSSYFHVPGYSLAAPVIGCLAYEASSSSSDGISQLELKALGDPISISFAEVAPNSTMIKCARLGPEGSVVQLSNMTANGVCSTTTTGHFTVVVPSLAPPPASGETRWRVWVVACGVGGLAMVVGLVGMGIFRKVSKKKLEDMERNAEEGDALGTVWARGSKMPSAAMMRTQPVVEDGAAAP